jgi:tetratricopeptide (TPR) repeat protein
MSNHYYQLGEDFSKKEQWNEAVIAYQQAIEVNPNFAWAYHKLGEALTQLGSYREAVEAYKNAIKLKPEFPWSYHKLGETLIQLERWDEVILAYRRFIELQPESIWAYNKLGDACQVKGLLDEALFHYNRFLEHKPKSLASRQNVGEILQKLGRTREAINWYCDLLEWQQNNEYLYRILRKLFLEAGNFQEAIATFKNRVKINQNIPTFYVNLGNELGKLERWEEAAIAYRYGIDLKPESYWLRERLGFVLEKMGKLDEALTYYEQIIKMKPDIWNFHSALGHILVKKGEFSQAVLAFKGAIEVKPDFFWLHYNLGETLAKLERWDEAFEAYRNAFAVESDNHLLLKYLDATLQKFGDLDELIYLNEDFIDYQILVANIAVPLVEANLGNARNPRIKSHLKEAIAYYKDAINNLNPEAFYYKIFSCLPLKPEFYLYVGNLLAKDERLNEAIIVYCRGLQIEPNFEEIKEQLEKQLSNKEQLEREVVSTRKALELNPKSFELYYNLGVALSQLQKWEEAARACRRAIELEPNHIDAYNLLGEALEKRGLKEEAIAYYEQAIVLQPPRKRQLLTIPANQPIKVKFTDFHKEFSYNKPSVVRGIFEKHYKIRVSDDPDFLFYSVYGNEHKNYDCTKIFTTIENRYNSLDYHRNDGRSGIRQIDFRECDFAISHYYLEDPRHYRMPLYFRREGIEGIKKLKKPKNIEEIISRKTKFCCFVYSNKKAVRRINFFRKLNQYKKVDSGGKVMNNMGFFAPTGRQFIQFLSEYKFVIAFENSSTPGYTTEKIFWPLQARTIPIYWGNPWIGREFNPASFINCHDYARDEEVIARVIELDNNEELYRKVLARPYLKSNKIPDSFKTKNILKFFDKIFKIKR